MTALATVYCTDEDIALRAPMDYANLVPKWQKLASASDGVFLASDLWTLGSASTDFGAAGIKTGHVAVLTAPRTRFSGLGELFAIDSVNGSNATLRRLGQTAGVGLPPAPAAGLTAVSFTVYTFAPQIDSASYDANKFFGIDPNLANRSPNLLYDQRELQQFTVLTVLKRAYIASEKEAAGDYEKKLALVAAELSDLQSRLQVHWGSLKQGDPPNSIFAARMRR